MWNPFAKKAAGPPIQNVEAIDVVGKRQTGGVDLVIVASAHLDGSPDIQRILLRKIESYIAQLNGPEFVAEFGKPSVGNTTIVLSCVDRPDPLILELIEKCKPWVADNNASLRVKIGEA